MATLRLGRLADKQSDISKDQMLDKSSVFINIHLSEKKLWVEPSLFVSDILMWVYQGITSTGR